NANKHRSESSTRGNQQVILREIAWRGPQPVEFPMTKQAGNKQCNAEKWYGDPDGDLLADVCDQVRYRSQRHRQQTNHQPAPIESAPVECNHEGQKVDGERKDPQQRNGGNVLAQVTGNCRKQKRPARCSGQPQRSLSASRGLV